jgi:DNA repair exonuclease SbcCD ATPase subunit
MIEEKLDYITALKQDVAKLNQEKQETSQKIDELRQEWEQSNERATGLKKELSGLNTSFAGAIIHMFTAPIAAGLFPFGEITILLLLTLAITVPIFFKIAKNRITVGAKATTAILERTYIEKDLEREEGLLSNIEQAILKKEDVITQIEKQIIEITKESKKTASKTETYKNQQESTEKL